MRSKLDNQKQKDYFERQRQARRQKEDDDDPMEPTKGGQPQPQKQKVSLDIMSLQQSFPDPTTRVPGQQLSCFLDASLLLFKKILLLNPLSRCHCDSL